MIIPNRSHQCGNLHTAEVIRAWPCGWKHVVSLLVSENPTAEGGGFCVLQRIQNARPDHLERVTPAHAISQLHQAVEGFGVGVCGLVVEVSENLIPPVLHGSKKRPEGKQPISGYFGLPVGILLFGLFLYQ